METPEQSPANSDSPIVGDAPLYIRPELLSLEQHGKLGLKNKGPQFSFGFAAKQHFMPLVVGEFGVASGNYPIVFSGADYTPIGVMGVNAGENLFINPDGSIKPDAYMTAYMRRYPFTVANDEAMGRQVICVDAGSDLIGENPDIPFFENGELSQYTKNSIEFCQTFEDERAKTEAFVRMLRELDIFEHKEATYTPGMMEGQPTQPVLIAGYFAISEDKLRALPVDKFIQLRDSGALGLIYAHLQSLWNWDRLVSLAMTRRREAQAAGAA